MSIAIPRIRDFRGMSTRSFDGRGNYSLGVREQIIFPEIDYDSIDQTRGMDITITTSANTDAEAYALLEGFGFPFARDANATAAGWRAAEEQAVAADAQDAQAVAEDEPEALAPVELQADGEAEAVVEPEVEPEAVAETERQADTAGEPETVAQVEPEAVAEPEASQEGAAQATPTDDEE